MQKTIIAVLMILVAGCASISKEEKWSKKNENMADLLVFRDPGSHSVALSAYFGSAENYVVGLSEKQYTTFSLPAGEQVFQAKAQGSASSSLTLLLEKDKKTCVRLIADPAQWAAMAVPILAAVVPAFKIESVECPSGSLLASYKRVSVKL